MLRFEQQDEFEAWLRACPLEQRRLSYGVIRSGVDGILSVNCSWRTPALETGVSAVRGTVSACASSAPLQEIDAEAAGNSNLGGDAGDGGTGSKAEEIAALRANLERMRGFVAADGRGGSQAALMAGLVARNSVTGDNSASGSAPGSPPAALVAAMVESSCTAGGTAAIGGGPDEKARGEAALAAMLQARESGASTREQVRACLSMALGGLEFPKPPGSEAADAPVTLGGGRLSLNS